MIGVTLKYGQLGNNLMVYANMMAVAEEYGLMAIYPAFHNYASEFVGTVDNPLCRYPATHLFRQNPETRRFLYRAFASVTDRIGSKQFPMVTRISVPPGNVMDANDPVFIEAARKRIVLTDGWAIRNTEMVIKYADKVRAYFTPVAKYQPIIDETIAAARKDADVLIGIHIRKTDNLTFMGGRYYWTDEQYARRMKDFYTLFPDQRLHFLICSDEPIAPQFFEDFPASPCPGSMIGDMYTLAGCDYIFGSPSTFSRWSSFYGRVPGCFVDDVELPITMDGFLNFESPNYLPNEPYELHKQSLKERQDYSAGRY